MGMAAADHPSRNIVGPVDTGYVKRNLVAVLYESEVAAIVLYLGQFYYPWQFHIQKSFMRHSGTANNPINS